MTVPLLKCLVCCQAMGAEAGLQAHASLALTVILWRNARCISPTMLEFLQRFGPHWAGGLSWSRSVIHTSQMPLQLWCCMPLLQ